MVKPSKSSNLLTLLGYPSRLLTTPTLCWRTLEGMMVNLCVCSTTTSNARSGSSGTDPCNSRGLHLVLTMEKVVTVRDDAIRWAGAAVLDVASVGGETRTVRFAPQRCRATCIPIWSASHAESRIVLLTARSSLEWNLAACCDSTSVSCSKLQPC